jgi:hypothetical protein
MSRPPVHRIAVLLLLAAFLLPLQAASAAPGPAPGFLPQLWTLLAGLLPDAGCILDPSGLCKGVAPALPASLDAGCGLDPDGRCKGTAPALPAALDAGCIIDPSGGCKGGS